MIRSCGKFSAAIYDILLNRQENSSDVLIDSTTLPLHFFYHVHIPSVSNSDPNLAASVRFIDSTTLPLHSDPIHDVCDIPAAWWHSAIRPIIYVHYHIPQECGKTKWYSAGSLHFLSQGPQDCESPDLTLRICVVILKCPAVDWLNFKIFKGKQHFENVELRFTNIPSLL
jgi:hypothetical protein